MANHHRPHHPKSGSKLQLLYAVSVSPDPLAIGQTGTVTLDVTSGDPTIYCDNILLSVPVGDDDDSLFQTTPQGSVSPASWTCDAAEIVPGEVLGLVGGTYATIKFHTDDPSAYAAYPLRLTLEAQVGLATGSFTIVIDETAGKTSDPGGFTKNRGQQRVEVGTPPFHIQNFVATAVAAGEDPCTEFVKGATIYLSWEGNADSYALWKKGDATAFWTGGATDTATSIDAPPTDTTFVLVATSTTVGTHMLIDALTVTISNPDLTPNSVAVADTLSVAGATTLAGATSTAGVTIGTSATPANLTVNGALSVGAITATTATTSGLATVGALTTAGAVTAGTLGAGATTLAATTVNGTFVLSGPSQIVAAPQTLAINTNATFYNATTDGFLVAFVGQDTNGIKWHNHTRMALYSSALGAWVQATGGNYCAQAYGDDSWWMGGNAGTACLPIQAGTQFGVQQILDPNNDDNGAPCSCWFVPFGINALLAPCEPTEAPANLPLPPGHDGAEQIKPSIDGSRIVSAIDAAMQDPSDEATRALFRRLVVAALEATNPGP